ncbi:hypothetical protein [Zavarzinella formosa]|uniref:hypothetical protein n=1 Tax=Zavarzinella formosa TaxID=360055 RepID=UPI000497ED24|nr:hypothetical protein [Zavarzinella formosa]
MRLQHRAFDVFADYHQFYLWDRGMTNQAPEDYTDEDVRRRIKTGPHVVVIQPERNTTVPVEVEVHDADPGFDSTAWDHVAEASLHLPTGRLQVHECIGGPVAEFAVEPGWYRVRSLADGFATITDQDAGDRYHVVLWPAPPDEVRVVKQWIPAE